MGSCERNLWVGTSSWAHPLQNTGESKKNLLALENGWLSPLGIGELACTSGLNPIEDSKLPCCCRGTPAQTHQTHETGDKCEREYLEKTAVQWLDNTTAHSCIYCQEGAIGRAWYFASCQHQRG
jgi:hypothetical protein